MEEAIEFAKKSIGFHHPLKTKQVETIKELYDERDCISVLPTGYGKSVIFQLLPWLLQYKMNTPNPLITIVISPLNSLMQDQVLSLASKGIKACYLNVEVLYEISQIPICVKLKDLEGHGAQMYQLLSQEVESEENEEMCNVYAPKFVSVEALRKGDFNLIYAHPETLLNNKTIANLLRSKVYRDNVCAIVIDEVHMISEWGDHFRTAYSRLSEIICLFPLPRTVHLALTATSTKDAIKKLACSLQLTNPCVVFSNPDRPNIFIEISRAESKMSKCDRLDAIIKQLGEELLNKMDKFPVTIVYINNLDSVGYCYELMSSIMLEKQYIPVDHRIPENRIFAQYHRQYTKKMKDFIVNEIRKEDPKVRLVFATVALGMGLDAPSVQQIIHLQPPTTMEKYMQEIGRSGRNGQLSVAKMYYTTRDIASNRKGLSPAMRSFCLSKKCLRQEIVSYFGFGNTLFQGEKRSCCSNCNL